MRRLAPAALLLLAAAAALAYIPPAERVASRAADANRLGGRAQPLAIFLCTAVA